MDKIQDILVAFIYVVDQPDIIKDLAILQEELNKKVSDNVFSQKGLACEKGCAYCCYGWEVKLTFAELFLFLKELNKLDNFLKKEIAKNLEKFKKGYDEKTPCPFLVDNLCSVYEARPFVCRTFSSYDKRLCEERVTFKFPVFIEEIIKKIVIPFENEIVDEFRVLFNTKTSIKNLNFDAGENCFYVDILNFVKIYTIGDDYIFEPLELYKKFAGGR